MGDCVAGIPTGGQGRRDGQRCGLRQAAWPASAAAARCFTELGFSVGGGEALLVTGRNGAGKSSLLRMVAGLVRIAGGRLALAGGDADKTIPEQAHYLGHQDALKPSLTVAENLAILGALSRRRGRRRARRWRPSGWTPWPTCRRPICRPASGGGCRIARLLAVARPIWLLDEPTSALDREAQDMLAGLMRQHLAGGGLIVAAAHGPIGLDARQRAAARGSAA